MQLKRLLEQFSQIFPRLCPDYKDASFEVRYKTGWAQGDSLGESLAKSIERDKQLGYTRSGTHAADWSFKINGFNPAEIFSRGQQKLLFLALCMSQAKITEQIQNEKSILLFDDLSSELDILHQKNVMKELRTLPVQSFITATNVADIVVETDTVFHVESGQIRQ
jgi:DNA replication and repair protein RecF